VPPGDGRVRWSDDASVERVHPAAGEGGEGNAIEVAKRGLPRGIKRPHPAEYRWRLARFPSPLGPSITIRMERHPFYPQPRAALLELGRAIGSADLAKIGKERADLRQ